MSWQHQQYPSEPSVRFLKLYKAENDLKDKTFLDVGTGGGRNMKLAHQEGFTTIHGIDIDEEAAMHDDVSRHDICKSPFAAADVVICDGVLDHVPLKSFTAGLANLAKSVADGGWLCLSLIENCPQEIIDKLDEFMGIMEATYKSGCEKDEVQLFFDERAIDNVMTMMKWHGLKCIFQELDTRQFSKNPDLSKNDIAITVAGSSPSTENWGRWWVYFVKGE